MHPKSLAEINHEADTRHTRGSYTAQTSLKDAKERKFLSFPNAAKSQTQLFVWGDSHARAIIPGILLEARTHEISFEGAWHGGTPPTTRYVPNSPFSLGEDSPVFNQEILKYILDTEISDVLLVGRWGPHFLRATEGCPFSEDLLHTVQQITNSGRRVWIMLEWPEHFVSVPRVLFWEKRFGLEKVRFASTLLSHAKLTASMTALIAVLEKAGARIIDPAPALFDPSAGHYRIDLAGHPLYYDRHHVSVIGAEYLSRTMSPIFSAIKGDIYSQDGTAKASPAPPASGPKLSRPPTGRQKQSIR